MNPQLRNILGTLGACIVAVYLGLQIAEGEYALPALCAALIVAAVLVRLSRLPVDVIVLGLLLAGYLVGNRGFAQLMPVSGLPLLPAEIVLMIALGWRGLVCAFQRRLPWRQDALNIAVLAWLIVGTARLPFDLPRHGLLAVRDYAMIYYALFFFIAQHLAGDPRARRYLIGCLLVATLLMLPLFMLSDLFPAFFLTNLTVRGTPLIYFKGDLVMAFLAVGSLLWFHWARGAQRFWAWPLAAVMFAYVAPGNNRSSLVGVMVAGGLLLLARRWRYPAMQGAVMALGLLAVFTLASSGNTWAEEKIAGLGDRLSSVVDLTGTGRYTSRESFYKGDNNRFRYVWWRNVAEETWSENPVFGLGFGADLARGFQQEYYADSAEDLSARSPHNISLTAFGRMGAIGLIVWLTVCATILRYTWRNLRRGSDPVTWALWGGAWAILISASFGVVLEGPMGAVLFWSLLGIAHAQVESPETAAAPTPAEGEVVPALEK